MIQTGKSESFTFKQIYDKSYNRIYQYIYYRTLDTFITEDIISNVYIKLYTQINTGKFKYSTESETFSWLFKVSYNEISSYYRTNIEHEALDIAEDTSNSDNNDLYNKSKLEEVLNYMENLSERDKNILILRIWEELSYEEISNITGESVSNCKKIVSRSLQNISANVSYLFIFSLLLNYVI